jgi:hypothetical protein
MPPLCIVSLPENAIIFPISADFRAALSHFDERRKMRPSDVRRLRRLRKRAAILAANGGKDPDSLGSREARVRPIDIPAGEDDEPGILADLIADLARPIVVPADDDALGILADLARSLGLQVDGGKGVTVTLQPKEGRYSNDPAKADPISGGDGPVNGRIKPRS